MSEAKPRLEAVVYAIGQLSMLNKSRLAAIEKSVALVVAKGLAGTEIESAWHSTQEQLEAHCHAADEKSLWIEEELKKLVAGLDAETKTPPGE